MKNQNSIPGKIYFSVAAFGENYISWLKRIAAAVFKRPVLFIINSLRRLLRFIFRAVIMVFAPVGADEDSYIADVTRAFKTSVKTLFTHPGSFFSVIGHYIKKGAGAYNYGVKTLVLWLVPAAAAVGLILGINLISDKKVALKIDAAGETIGYVATEDEFIAARDAAMSVLSGNKKDALSSMPEIRYSLRLIGMNEFTDRKTIERKILEKSETDLETACGVYIDSEFFGAVSAEADARKVFNSILDEKKSGEENYIVSFVEDIDYVQGLYPESSVMSSEAFRNKLLYGSDTDAVYLSVEGDTPETVAEKKEISVERLLSFNPGLKAETEIEEGTEISLKNPSSPLTVREIKSVVSNESVDFPVQEIQSDALYSGSKKIVSEGKKGYAQVTDLVTYVDGKVTDKKEFSRITRQEPVPQRVQIGIKPLDSEYSSSFGGMLLWPVIGAYAINSPYGYRWGKIHRGIDIGVGDAPGTSLGKTIVAVAPGTVVAAGVYPSYGYFVKIDHGNGLQTAYGHCLENSLLVVPGQTVAAGQPIAQVGQTGYATGPHLHFEVRINGNKVDPAPYLGITY